MNVPDPIASQLLGRAAVAWHRVTAAPKPEPPPPPAPKPAPLFPYAQEEMDAST